MFAKYSVDQYIFACEGFQHKRINNPLNVQLVFERFKVIIHHKGGERKADYLVMVSYAEVIINANPIPFRLDPKELRGFLEVDRNTYESFE